MKQTADEAALAMLGFAARARRLAPGVALCCEAMKKGGAGAPRAVALAADAAENSAKRIADRCRFYGVPLVRLGADAATLARAIGKSGTVAAVGVTDEHLATAVLTAAHGDQ